MPVKSRHTHHAYFVNFYATVTNLSRVLLEHRTKHDLRLPLQALSLYFDPNVFAYTSSFTAKPTRSTHERRVYTTSQNGFFATA